MSARRHVHLILEGSHERIGAIVSWALAGLIATNIVAICLETVPSLQAAYATTFRNFEAGVLVIFTTEYLLRLWSCAEQARFRGLTGRLRWMVTPAALIDFLAIAPSLFVADLRLVRILRLARLVRIAKLGRYSLALRTLRSVMLKRLPDLISLSFVLLILLVLSSALMYHLESEAQPEQFSSIPATMWWGIVTLTTIGYGDMAPITVGGRLLGAVVAVLGIGMFALPAGLLGGAFVEELGKARRKDREQRSRRHDASPARCPHCDEPLPHD